MNTARFLKYVWPFYNIMHERVKKFSEKFSYDTFEITNTYDAKHSFTAASTLLKHLLQKLHFKVNESRYKQRGVTPHF